MKRYKSVFEEAHTPKTIEYKSKSNTLGLGVGVVGIGEKPGFYFEINGKGITLSKEESIKFIKDINLLKDAIM